METKYAWQSGNETWLCLLTSAGTDKLINTKMRRQVPTVPSGSDQQELHRTRFKSRLRRREESLQELAEDIERLARLAYPLAPDDMKDLLAKEQFIDAILDGDTRLRLKQSKPQSLRDAPWSSNLIVLPLAKEIFMSAR